ncbi:MAG: hypothetical protein AAGI48_04620 [Verrucomicrobiota bacterium]
MDPDDEGEDERLEGADLCICCLFPVRPGSDLCLKCGAPHGALAGFFPLTRVLAEGYILRQAVQRPRSLWSVAGIWVLYFPQAALGLVVLPVLKEPIALSWEWAGYLLGYVVGVLANTLLGLAAMMQSVHNYLRWKAGGSA